MRSFQWWCEVLVAVTLTLRLGHTAADTGFTAAPDSKTLDCSSLRTGIDDLATVPGEASNTTFTVFPALLDVLGFTAGRITNLDVNTALVPSDRAFEDFFVEVGGDGVDPLSLVKRNPDVFKQIVLHHFTKDAGGLSGSVSSALAKVPDLDSEGFIDLHAICGQNDSQFITLEYSRTDDKYTFKDVFSSHFEAHTTNTPCSNAPVTLIHTVDTVLLPCPIPYLFSPDSQYGCASMASILPSFFSTLAYKKQSGTILDNTKHPNFASNGGPGGLTLFLPTAASITNSGVGQESFIRIDNALDHIISAHVIRGQYCIGGGGDVSQSFWAGRWNGANGERAAERSVSGTVATVQAGLSLGSSAVVAADVESGQAPSMAPLSMGQPVAAAPENPTAQAPVGDTEVIVTEEPAEVIVTEEPDAVTPPVGDPGGVSQPEGTPEGDPGEVTTGGLPGGEPEGEPVVQKEDGARTRAPRGSVTATPEAQVAGISDTPEDGTNSFASSGASSIADIGTINPVEPATDSALFEESTAFEQLARRLLARRLQDLGAVTAAAGPAAAAREVEEPEQGVAAPAPASSPAVVASEPWSAITLLNPGFCAPSATIKVKEGTGDFPASATISSPNGATALTTSRINIRVCGGYVHEIDRVLMPCSYAVYQAASDEERDGQDAQVASTPVDSSAGGSVNRRGWGLLCASATLLGVSWLLPP